LVHGKTKRARRGQTDYISGPPELIAEIAASTESIDLFEKRRDYEEYGVGEYIAFLIRTGRVIWFVRESGRFVELSPDADGILRSRLFPGLWLDPVALLAGDLRRVQEVVNQGVATPEHLAFAAELATRQSSPAEKP
jgi:Uma2 family endonuclease